MQPLDVRLLIVLSGALYFASILEVLPVAAEENLIEYSYGGFAEGDSMSIGLLTGPMLYPPPVKIYENGRIVFFDEGRFRTGILSDHQLQRLRQKLERSHFLRESRIVPTKKGRSPGFHEGMAYLRYLDGDEEAIVGSFLIPTRGPWHRLVQYLLRLRPDSHRAYVPKEAELLVFSEDCNRGNKSSRPVDWPFHSELPLSRDQDRITVTRDDQVRWLMDNFEPGFSWFKLKVCDSDSGFELILSSAPDWYEPLSIASQLGAMGYEERRDEIEAFNKRMMTIDAKIETDRIQSRVSADELPGKKELQETGWRVERADKGLINGMPSSLFLELEGPKTRTIDRAWWWNPLREGSPQFDYRDFLATISSAFRTLQDHTWIRSWKSSGDDRHVELHTFGNKALAMTPIESASALSAWRHAGLVGSPTVQVILRREPSSWAEVIFGDLDNHALILNNRLSNRTAVSEAPCRDPDPAEESPVSETGEFIDSRPLPLSNWLDTHEFFYHESQITPEYVLVTPPNSWRENGEIKCETP